MLLAFLAVASLGLLLFVRSWWGPIIDARVRCRKCGYDLTGGVALTGKCPECSRSLKRPNAISAGTRARRHGRAVVGLAIVLVAGLAVFVQHGGELLRSLDPYKPGFWLLMEAQSREGRTVTPAFAELERRLVAGELADDFVAQVVDIGLARARGDDGAGAWAPRWSNFIEQAVARKQVDYERALAYADVLIGPDPTVHFPSEVRSGEPLELRAAVGSVHAPNAGDYRLVFWWDAVTVDGARVAFQNAFRGMIEAGPRLEASYSALVDSHGPVGDTEVVVHAHIAVVHADDLTHEWSLRTTPDPAPHGGPPAPLLTRSFTARARVVRRAGTYEDPELLARVRAAIRVSAERIVFGTESVTTVNFEAADLPPLRATYTVTVMSDDGTPIGTGELSLTDNRVFGRASTKTDTSTIDVVLEPNAEPWIRWGPVLAGRIEFRGVPVTVRDVSAQLARDLEGMRTPPPHLGRTLDDLLADPDAAGAVCARAMTAPPDELDRIVAHAERELHANGIRAWAPAFPIARRRGRLSDAAWRRFLDAALGERSLFVRPRGAAGGWAPFTIDIQPDLAVGTSLDRFPCVRIRPIAVRVNDIVTAVEAEPLVFALAALGEQQLTGRLRLPDTLGPGAVELTYDLECGWSPEGVAPLLMLAGANQVEIADIDFRSSGTLTDTMQIAKTATRLVPQGMVDAFGDLRRPAELAVEVDGAQATVRVRLSGERSLPVCAWPEVRIGGEAFRASAPITFMPWEKTTVIEVPIPTPAAWPAMATLAFVPAPDVATDRIDLAEIVGFEVVFEDLPVAFGRGPK